MAPKYRQWEPSTISRSGVLPEARSAISHWGSILHLLKESQYEGELGPWSLVRIDMTA